METVTLAPAAERGVRVRTAPAKSILTPATGFISKYRYTLNPYSGCAFGCAYCYAAAFTPRDIDEASWGAWVRVKENACLLLQREIVKGRVVSGDAIYMASVTDPYQPVERRLGLTRSILQTFLAGGVQPRLTVQTRSPLAARDIDLFRQFDSIRVNFTITTDSEEVRRRYEPRCAPIEARLRAAEQVASAGVPVGICVSPMLPMADVETFGRRIAAIGAAEYVSQHFHDYSARRRFATSTRAAALPLAHDDRWGPREYARTRDRLAAVLSSEGAVLLEGGAGFSPPT
jgi:DNA repair photolyase